MFNATMEAAFDLRHQSRGAELLLSHCATLGRIDDARPTAVARLELAVGCDLARLLLSALVGPHGRRGSSSP